MDRRLVAIGLCVAAALCLAFAAVSSRWLVNASAHAELRFGLRSYTECLDAQCAQISNAEAVDQWRDQERPGGPKLASGAFVPMGWVTFVDLWLIVVGLVGAAALAALRKQPQLPIAPSTIALVGIMIALISGCVFVATKPGPNGMVGVGLSFFVFGAGCVIGIAAAQLSAKVNRPADPDLMADAMNPDDY